MVTNPEELTEVEMYRDPSTGKLIGRDPETGDTFPIPFDQISANSVQSDTAHVDGTATVDALEAESASIADGDVLGWELIESDDTNIGEGFSEGVTIDASAYDMAKVVGYTYRGTGSSSLQSSFLRFSGYGEGSDEDDYSYTMMDRNGTIDEYSSQNEIEICSTANHHGNIPFEIMVADSRGTPRDVGVSATIGGNRSSSFRRLLHGAIENLDEIDLTINIWDTHSAGNMDYRVYGYQEP